MSVPNGTAAVAAQPGTVAETPEARCTIVIVTYRSAAHLPRLLADLRAEAASCPFEVVVVDNASTDDTVAIARSAGVRVVQTGANLGYAGALNVAAGHTAADRPVLVLNPDLSVEPGAIATLLAAIDAEPRTGIAVPSVLDDDDAVYPSLRREPSLVRAAVDAVLGRRAAHLPGPCSEMVWDPAVYGRTAHPQWATGAALLITAECARRVGRWDDGRFFLYSEETDYFRRARDAGFTVVYVPAARVRHSGGGSGSSPELVAMLAVNRVRYYRKYHGPLAAVAFHSIVVVHELLRSRGRAHRTALRALLRPAGWNNLVPRDGRGRAGS